ncbi:MAG: TolC family protein, partial [Bacteroidota bacterium]
MIWRIPAATVLTFLFSATCIAQQKTLTLEEAIKQAESNYPTLGQRELVAARGEEKIKILDHAAYPQTSIVGQGTYQSEVTSFNAPGFPAGLGQKPDNYNIGLDLRLPLTQFGILRSRKQLEAAQTGLTVSQIELETQRIRETVSNLFGNIILQKENRKILEIRLAELNSQLGKVRTAVESGSLLKSSQLILESEILSTQQRLGDISGTLGGMTQQ